MFDYRSGEDLLLTSFNRLRGGWRGEGSYVTYHMETSPTPGEETDTTENVTFPQTTYVGGTFKILSVCHTSGYNVMSFYCWIKTTGII